MKLSKKKAQIIHNITQLIFESTWIHTIDVAVIQNNKNKFDLTFKKSDSRCQISIYFNLNIKTTKKAKQRIKN